MVRQLKPITSKLTRIAKSSSEVGDPPSDIAETLSCATIYFSQGSYYDYTGID